MIRNALVALTLFALAAPTAFADHQGPDGPGFPPPPPGFGHGPGGPGHGGPGYPPPPPPNYGGGDNCRPGSQVWTDSGSEGQIQAVFPNGQVSVKIGYANFMMDRSRLATPGCMRNLCSGMGVITDSGSQGTINGVFPNGTLSVKIGYANFQMSYDRLASTQQDPYCPPGRLQVNQQVWTDSGSEGRVAGLFPNGAISVQIGYAYFQMSRERLAAQGCLGNLCSGDNVITDSGSRGTVNGVFPDYRSVSVKIGYANFQMDYSRLAKAWQ